MTSHAPVRPLPARAVPLPGESLISLVRRTSQAMAYENPRQLVALLLAQGLLPPHLNELAPGPVLDHLAQLLHLSAESLAPLTVHHYAPSLVLASEKKRTPQKCDAGTVQRYFAAAGPICPHCLQQAAVPLEWLLWSFRPAPICAKHGFLLVGRCPECNRLLRSDRPDVTRCTCGAVLHDADSVPVSDYGVELTTNLHQLLLGQFLPVSETTRASWFWWAARLAAAASKTPDWLADVAKRLGIEPDTNLDSVAWLAAAEMLAEWPQHLETFLESFQRIDKHKSTSTGVGRRFGMLLRHAARLEDLGHPAPADALRCYLLDRYDGGHLSTKICLFAKPGHRAGLDGRSWITQTAAAKILGLRHGAVVSLIDRQILIGKVHSAGRNGRSVGLVSKRSLEALKAELQSAMDVETVASRLGIGRHAVLELIHRNMLPRAVRTANGWQIPPGSVEKLEAVQQQLPEGKPTATRWITVRQATRKFGPTGLTLGVLIEFILSGELAARMADPDRCFHGIVVRQADLVSLTPKIRAIRSQVDGYPIHQLARILFPGRPVKSTVLTKWIAARLLKARKTGRAHVISSEEVERFRSEYCLADEACRLLNVSRSTLSRWEVEGRIQAVYGKRVTRGGGFSLYRRNDLSKLSRKRNRPTPAGR
jgi:TniQ